MNSIKTKTNTHIPYPVKAIKEGTNHTRHPTKVTHPTLNPCTQAPPNRVS